ncbi:MAG TPA: hypothetical protein PLY93_04945 [Turneriella sp.]|nr:hypothetical protein [Turneriella sp.]
MTIINKQVFTKCRRLLAAFVAVSVILCSVGTAHLYAQGKGVQLKKKTPKKRIDAKGNLVEDIAAVEDMYDEGNIGSIAQLDPRAGRAFFAHTWFVKASATINYFNLGSDFQNVIKQIEGAFGGDTLNMKILAFNSDISMATGEKVARAPTHFLPTGNMSLGFYFGRHQLELEFGLAGLVPLKTVDLDTTMTLTDKTVVGSSAQCTTAANCPLANLGFVNGTSRQGQYKFQMTMNEDVWILTPSLSYDYVFLVRKWGRMSGGLGVGAMILSTSQQIAFKAVRTDLSSVEAPLDYLKSRVLQGTANSTNVTDIGPIFRLHFTYRPPPITKFLNTQLEIRAGFNYGFVYLNRDVDGTGQAILGDTLVGSFPLSSLGFKTQEVNKFELMGGFIQVGIVF